MAYVTLADFKAYQGISTSTDDTVISQILAGVSAYVDTATGRHFAPIAQTRYFDTPEGDTLYLDEDLVSVTSITNGDGTTITAEQYKLLPANHYPKYAIKLLPSANIYWTASTADDTEQAITVNGAWGYSSACPADIVSACLAIAKNAYSRITNHPNSDGPATITAAGVVIQPRDVGAMEANVLATYKKVTLR